MDSLRNARRAARLKALTCSSSKASRRPAQPCRLNACSRKSPRAATSTVQLTSTSGCCVLFIVSLALCRQVFEGEQRPSGGLFARCDGLEAGPGTDSNRCMPRRCMLAPVQGLVTCDALPEIWRSQVERTAASALCA